MLIDENFCGVSCGNDMKLDKLLWELTDTRPITACCEMNVSVVSRPVFVVFIGSLYASRYAIQHIWCLSQARINWEGRGRKGIRHKTGWMMEVGASMVQMSWHPAGLSVHLPLLSSPRLIKSRMMTDYHNMFQVWVGECLGQRAVKRLYVCVCVCVCTWNQQFVFESFELMWH